MADTELSLARSGRWAVAGLFFINGFMVGSWAAQIPGYIGRLGVNEATFGLMVLFFGLGGIIAMPTSGYFMSRHGSRAVALPLAPFAVVSLLVAVLCRDVVLATLALFAMGAVLGGLDVAMNANAVTVERRLKRPIMSSTHGFWSLGGFAGSGLGGLAIQEFGYLAHAVLVAVVTGAILAVAARHVVGSDRPKGIAPARRLSLPSQPTIYLIGLLATISVVPEVTARNWGALFMEQELGATTAVAGLAFALFSGAMAVGRFLGDAIRSRLGAVNTLRFSCLLTAGGLVVASMAPGVAITLLAFAAAGIGSANLIPIVFSAAGNHEGMISSSGLAVATTMSYAGILIAPSVTGLVAEVSGIGPVFAVGGLLLILAAVAGTVTRRADFRHEMTGA